MIKILGATLTLFLLTTIAYAGSTPQVSGWANISEFCSEETIFLDDEDLCIELLKKYQQATKEHLESLSATELRRISDGISKLSDKDSDQAKNLRKAVDNIGETLRRRIEIPTGVRRLPSRQEQYIQQQIQ